MKMMCLRIALLALVATEVASVSPVQKVLQMMTEMKAKGEKMVEAEKKTYGEYSEWVDDQSTQLGFDIKTANSDIEELLANIAKADSDVDTLGASIGELDGEISKLTGEKNEATEIRNSEHAEYEKVSADYGESVDALKRAIQTMESRNYDVAQAESLLQRMAAGQNSGMRRVLAEFMQVSTQQEQKRGGPAVAAYEFQSGGIVQLLEKFLDKFKGELADIEEAESNQAHNYKQEMLHLSDTIDYSNKEHEEKSVLKTKRTAESANAKGNLVDTKASLAEDKKTLADMKATFAAKTDQFKQNQVVRADELEAIAKAIEIISDPSVSGSYKEHMNLVQTKATSLLQLGSARSRLAVKSRAASFLRERAQALSSQTLASLATQFEANPFDKVINMIKDLVAKLKEEAAAEAEHKAWCDEQLHDNKIKREKKTAKVNKLTASVEGLAEDIDTMAKKIATLSSEQAALQKAMSEATEQRMKEKATNTDTMADASAGEDAVKQAVVVLKEFYSSQGSFLQQAPEMAAYKGMGSAKGGVVGMLEVIASDFARLFADTKASETAAAQEYDTFMGDSKGSVKAKHDLEFKTGLAKDQAEYDKGETAKDLTATQKELDKALSYQEHLKPVCLEVHVSYEERVQRRKDEIAALKEAYSILDSK